MMVQADLSAASAGGFYVGYYYFKCRSVTYARRVLSLLKGKGIYAWIVKLPVNFNEEGCGYSLKISERQFNKALELLKVSDFDIKQILYSQDERTFKTVQL